MTMDDGAFYSRAQYMCLVIAMAVSSFLSMMASLAIARIAYLKMTSTYQRFLFMLSQVNILNSIFLLVHQLIIPRSGHFYWAFGNEATCTVAGFFFLLGSLATAIYSSFLSLYFYFSIYSSAKRDKQPEGIIGFWEWCAHVASFLIPGGIAITAVATQNIDVAEGLGLCIIANLECVEGGIDQSHCTPSWRDGIRIPQDTSILRWAYVASMAAAAATCMFSTLLVHRKVNLTLNRDDSGLPEEMKQRLQAVATQAILYTSVFLNTLIWPMLAIMVPSDENRPQYSLHILAFFFYPLQGVFNCYIYIRPRYQMLRTMYPDDSMLVVVRVSLSRAGDPDEIEEVRERIYGDKYVPPTDDSSVHSIESGLPKEVAFNPHSPLSKTSLISVPADDDEMDHEADEPKQKARLENVEEGVSGDDSDGTKSS